MSNRKNIIKNHGLFFLFMLLAIDFTCVFVLGRANFKDNSVVADEILNIEEYSGQPYIEVNGNIPFLTIRTYQ